MKRVAVVGLALVALATTGPRAQETGPIGASQRAETPQARWQAERAGMLKQVVERARAHVRDVKAMVEIGTVARMDVTESEQSLADLEKLVDADAKRPDPRAMSSQPGIAVLRIRFAEALNDLDRTETRFANGMVPTKSMSAALMAAATVLLGPAPLRVP